jgi:methionyl-tRNA formyltransferase
MRKTKIGYFADGPWSHNTLVNLLQDSSIDICFICARNDNPDLTLKSIALRNNIDFLTHGNINSNEFISIMKIYECDLFVSMSFNQIFGKEMLNLPNLRIINCHAGKLPFYRGRNVLNWVLINDEKDFGITVHYVDNGIDTGDIILQKIFPISDHDDYSTLLSTAYVECAHILYESIKLIQFGKVKLIKQMDINSFGSYCIGRKPGDELVNWNQSSRDIFNFVRAITLPGPVARTYLNEGEIKILKVDFLKDAPLFRGIPGSIIGSSSLGLQVKTKDSFVNVSNWISPVKPRIGDRFN